LIKRCRFSALSWTWREEKRKRKEREKKEGFGFGSDVCVYVLFCPHPIHLPSVFEHPTQLFILKSGNFN